MSEEQIERLTRLVDQLATSLAEWQRVVNEAEDRRTKANVMLARLTARVTDLEVRLADLEESERGRQVHGRAGEDQGSRQVATGG